MSQTMTLKTHEALIGCGFLSLDPALTDTGFGIMCGLHSLSSLVSLCIRCAHRAPFQSRCFPRTLLCSYPAMGKCRIAEWPCHGHTTVCTTRVHFYLTAWYNSCRNGTYACSASCNTSGMAQWVVLAYSQSAASPHARMHTWVHSGLDAQADGFGLSIK